MELMGFDQPSSSSLEFSGSAGGGSVDATSGLGEQKPKFLPRLLEYHSYILVAMVSNSDHKMI